MTGEPALRLWKTGMGSAAGRGQGPGEPVVQEPDGGRAQVLPGVLTVQRVLQASVPGKTGEVHAGQMAWPGGKPGPAHAFRTSGSGTVC